MSLMIFFRSESARRASVRLSVLSVVVSTIFHFLFYNDDVFFLSFRSYSLCAVEKKRRISRHFCCVSLNHLIFSAWMERLDAVAAVPYVHLHLWFDYFAFFVFSTWFIIIFPPLVSPHFPLSRRYFMRSECSYFTCL